MELRSKTLSSVSKNRYYNRKLATLISQVNKSTSRNLKVKKIATFIKCMIYNSKYNWMYITTCDSIQNREKHLKCLSVLYQKTFILQEEINSYSYHEINYYIENNFRKKCLTYRSLYEKKFESIFSEKIPLDVLRYILLFV